MLAPVRLVSRIILLYRVTTSPRRHTPRSCHFYIFHADFAPHSTPADAEPAADADPAAAASEPAEEATEPAVEDP